MTTNLYLFSKIMNHLVFLTTRDEYGSSRSRGISNLDELHIDLNEEGIVPSRGYWTENSLKLFFSRIKRQYTIDVLADECDFDFLGRHAWEYLSRTKHEEVCENRSVKPNSYWNMPDEPYPTKNYSHDDDQLWKTHESDEVQRHDKKMLKILNRMTPKRTLAH